METIFKQVSFFQIKGLRVFLLMAVVASCQKSISTSLTFTHRNAKEAGIAASPPESIIDKGTYPVNAIQLTGDKLEDIKQIRAIKFYKTLGGDAQKRLEQAILSRVDYNRKMTL